ncbi:hypothetical protein [Halobacillus sp. BBL2006]|uniref:hypothetical protein n=1 Tax=Halobacillus sp. BBL2006 TaxID=1543706 RepID=UPI0005435A5E|nr:hypothetical protein [Halobacillus sp. BBL2006]KHE67123.1 hypothetical protein LD39_19165 [Halobacillus sp. BBL2006]
MNILLEMLDGSYDLLFLSIYISLLVRIALETIWTHTVADTSNWMTSRHIVSSRHDIELPASGDVVEFVNDMIHWLQRTVRRKENSKDGDHFLFIRA